MQNPWDQQPNEPSKAFQRFAQYRDMGGGRSLRKLAKDLELNPSTLAEISKKHSWQERVGAFDAYIDKASQHNQIVQVKAMKRRQIVLALRAQKVLEPHIYQPKPNMRWHLGGEPLVHMLLGEMIKEI